MAIGGDGALRQRAASDAASYAAEVRAVAAANEAFTEARISESPVVFDEKQEYFKALKARERELGNAGLEVEGTKLWITPDKPVAVRNRDKLVRKVAASALSASRASPGGQGETTKCFHNAVDRW